MSSQNTEIIENFSLNFFYVRLNFVIFESFSYFFIGQDFKSKKNPPGQSRSLKNDRLKNDQFKNL